MKNATMFIVLALAGATLTACAPRTDYNSEPPIVDVENQDPRIDWVKVFPLPGGWHILSKRCDGTTLVYGTYWANGSGADAPTSVVPNSEECIG